MSSMVGDRLNPAVAAQLKGKRVLVTNDDGIDADGLARLEALARRYCDDVWVIAPATHQSARSRGITLRTPLRVVELGERRAAVTGTPLDTFMVGMQHFFDDRLPDLVLSGINHDIIQFSPAAIIITKEFPFSISHGQIRQVFIAIIFLTVWWPTKVNWIRPG